MDTNGSTGKKKTGDRVAAEVNPTEDITSVSANISKLTKQQVVEKFRRDPKDTGSPEVQIALLTHRLGVLSKHFGGHPKDYHSQRGMMGIVSQRKQLLQYLKGESVERYRSTLTALGLRK